MLGVPLSQDGPLLGDAYSTSAHVPMSKLLRHPQSRAPDAETPRRLWSGQHRPGNRAASKEEHRDGGEDNPGRENPAKTQALPGDAGCRQTDI